VECGGLDVGHSILLLCSGGEVEEHHENLTGLFGNLVEVQNTVVISRLSPAF
jgi:hypothetical protein